MTWAHEQEKGVSSDYQKWDYITLDDFKSKSCGSITGYIWVWYLVILSISVYGLDTFTAVNLLAYGRFNQIQPAIPVNIAKWIFAGCILFSWALCAYEWFIAIRVLRRGNVAESYLDPTASTVQSIRVGQGKGYKRYLVFAELTKSKKGADYVAIFCYFQFKCAIRIILAEGPRQVINAVTLYAAMKANLVPTGAHAAPKGDSNFDQFWTNVKILYDDNHEQALILLSMLITLIIWAFWAICLLISILLYIFFLWSYIPKSDGSLSAYCRRKIDSRLAKIVSRKVKQAIASQEAKRRKAEEKALRKGTTIPTQGISRAPTLPSLMADSDSDSIMGPPSLSRQTTQSSLAADSLSPSSDMSSMRKPTLPSLVTAYDAPSGRQPTLPNLSDELNGLRPSPLSRTETQASDLSADSYRSDRPLLQEAASMGMARPPVGRTLTDSSQGAMYNQQRRPPPMRRSPTGTSQDSYNNQSYGPPPFGRSLTGNSQSSFDAREQSADSYSRGYPQERVNASMPPNPFRPVPNFPGYGRPPVNRNMSDSQGSMREFGPPLSRPSTGHSASPRMYSREHSPSGSASFLPAVDGPAYEMQPRSRDPSPPKAYQAYNPFASSTASPANDTGTFNRPRSPQELASFAISPLSGVSPSSQMSNLSPHSPDALLQDQQQPLQPPFKRSLPARSATNPPPDGLQPSLPQLMPPRRVGTAPLPGTAATTAVAVDTTSDSHSALGRPLTPSSNAHPAPYRPGWT